jgi:2,3-bisphosphoglycerate-dependent phosphoglycerate mutase
METIIYFIRHAQPDYSIKDEMRPLTIEGSEKSMDLIKIFTNINIDYAYSSPYKRSIQTLEPIAQSKKLKISIVNNFHEIVKGNDWIEDFTEYYKNLWNDFSYKLNGGESLSEVQERNIKELEKILVNNKEKSIIIGTHGTALSTIINYYDSTFVYEKFLEIADKTPYIMKFQFNNGEYIMREEIKIQ